MNVCWVSILTYVTLLTVTSLSMPTLGMTSEEEDRVRILEQSVTSLWRQLMMLQLSQEEMRRSDGDSGIKQVRLTRDGTRPYHSNTHTGPSVAAIHDHADMHATCGLGEFEAVLNGVHFRTRHNDYPLRMPASTGEYHATAAIPFPAVPPAVLQKQKLEDQVAEMREWFRAWRDDDVSKRDFRPYFKPLLCYLEGAWSTDVDLEEPFLSHRHHLDAFDIPDLQQKIRFAAYTGDKHVQENLAYLPSMLLNITKGVPTMAQWNYRVLCHPVRQDVRLRDLRPVEELANRLASKHRWRDYVMSRAARFTLNPFSGEKAYKWNLLDKIMKEIPGKNNYGAQLIERTEGGLKLNAHNTRPLNTAYYHRWYKFRKPGAMGQKVAHTGFADRNLFVAETTQPRVAPMTAPVCSSSSSSSSAGKRKTCEMKTKRVSYAIPLEVVFLTPLHTWNPYRLPYKGDNQSPEGQTVTAQGRNGAGDVQSAFNGTNSRHFYRTPVAFFQSGKEVHSDPADTVKGVVGVLDTKGHLKSVVASGVRVFLPKIKGLGIVRTRYPIMPVYAEGSTVWKEVEAVREVVMGMDKYEDFFTSLPSFLIPRRHNGQKEEEEGGQNVELVTETGKLAISELNQGGSLPQVIPQTVQLLSSKNQPVDLQIPPGQTRLHPGLQNQIGSLRMSPAYLLDLPPKPVILVTSPSKHSYVALHVHVVEVSGSQYRRMVREGAKVKVRTTLGGGHSHLLEVGFDPESQYFRIHSCDHKAACWDGHSPNLEKVHNQHLLKEPDQLGLYG